MILFVSSVGGHSVELELLYENMPRKEAIKKIVFSGALFEGGVRYAFKDCSANEPVKCISNAYYSFKYLTSHRPSVVVSTGAAPGAIFVVVAKLLKIPTIWIDSLANPEEISLSGKIAIYFCDHFYSQSPHVKNRRVKYVGRLF